MLSACAGACGSPFRVDGAMPVFSAGAGVGAAGGFAAVVIVDAATVEALVCVAFEFVLVVGLRPGCCAGTNPLAGLYPVGSGACPSMRTKRISPGSVGWALGCAAGCGAVGDPDGCGSWDDPAGTNAGRAAAVGVPAPSDELDASVAALESVAAGAAAWPTGADWPALVEG